MYQPILKVYLSLLATLNHGRLGMPTSILLALLLNVKPKEEEHLLWLPVKPEQLTAINARNSVA